MAKAKKKSIPRNTVWTDEEKLFSENSKIVNIDLPKFFSSPEAWSTLEEAEKDQLRALLPPYVELNEDGSIPQSFLKYDPGWRDALHQFQVDLAAGHYNSSWLEEAACAMEERAAGVFDSFKETEFEEFWGQKQKVKTQLSGETATLKLANLISADLFQIGDVWSYKRKFGRSLVDRVQIEKDCVVTAIESGSMTFLIPPGRSKFLTTEHYLKDFSNKVTHGKPTQTTELLFGPYDDDLSESIAFEPACDGMAQSPSEGNSTGKTYGFGSVNQSKETQGSPSLKVPSKRPWSSCDSISPNSSSLPGAATAALVAIAPEACGIPILNNGDSAKGEHDRESSARPSHAKSSPLSTAPSSPSASDEIQPPRCGSEHSSSTNHFSTKIEHRHMLAATLTISAPWALEKRVIEVDGRIKNPPADNSWRNFRVRRREQDIGSLWEIREEFWVKGQPE